MSLLTITHTASPTVSPLTRRRFLASVEAGATIRTEARAVVSDVLRLVALSIDAHATSGTDRDAKYATLRTLVAEVAVSAATVTSPELATELCGLDADTGLTRSADRIVAIVRHALTSEDVAAILREVVGTRWDGHRMQCDPAVALGYAARLLAPNSTSTADLERLRRPGFLRRAFPHRAPATRHLQSVAATTSVDPTWREAGDAVVPGVLYLPLAAQAAARREAGLRPLASVGDDFSAA